MKANKSIRLKVSLFLFIAVLLITKQVKAFTITIDPGHGGVIPAGITNDEVGAQYNGLKEKDLTLKISQYLKEYLSNYQNVNVVMTRTGDQFVRVFNRAIVARNNNSDLLLSVHVNDSTDISATGVEAWVTANNSLYKYNQGTSKLSSMLLSNLSQLGFANRGVKTKVLSGNDSSDIYSDGTLADWYGIIRYGMRGTMIDYGVTSIYVNSTDLEKTTVATSCSAIIQNGEGVPTILLEHGFIKGDYNLLNTEDKLKKIAEADGKSIVEYYGLKLKKQLANTPFKDVYASDWYASAVEYTYSKGIIRGTTATTFNPNTKLTRGMLVTILHRMEGETKVSTANKFSDVSDSQYYYEAVKWAASKGIVHGYDNGNFGPDDIIKRQDVAAILRNYAQYKGKNTNVASDLTKFKDGTIISDYAKKAMQWAVEKGVITGNSDNTLTPHGASTRAEAASMLYKYSINIK